MDLTISDLVQRFDNGEIRLPLMQRDYIWKPRKVVELLDSLYRDWPIGSFYVWQTHGDHPAKQAGRPLPHRRMDGFYGFLLDGQQRLTSRSNAIRSDADGSISERASFDFGERKFYLGAMKKTIAKRIEAQDRLIVPLSDIVPSSRDANRNEATYRERLHKVAMLLKRKRLCEEFPDEDEEHAFLLFRRLNKGGTSLSAGDIEAARLASAATKKIIEPMRKEEAHRAALGYGDFDTTMNVVANAVARGPYLLGEQFTAGDVVIGATLRWGTIVKLILERPEFTSYRSRLAQRPALQRAEARDKELAAARTSAGQRARRRRRVGRLP